VDRVGARVQRPRRPACGPQAAEGDCCTMGDRLHGESPALSRLAARG
jgi:hypothetical protein